MNGQLRKIPKRRCKKFGLHFSLTARFLGSEMAQPSDSLFPMTEQSRANLYHPIREAGSIWLLNELGSSDCSFARSNAQSSIHISRFSTSFDSQMPFCMSNLQSVPKR
jgi:hypothetical protein